MNEIEVRDTVHAAGAEVSPQFRAAMRERLDATLSGEQLVSMSTPVMPSVPHRNRWLAVAAAVTLMGVTAAVLAFSDDERGTLTPVTQPTDSTTSPTAASTTAVPTTELPTTVAPTTVVPTSLVVTDPTAPLPDPNIPLLSVDASFSKANPKSPLVTVQPAGDPLRPRSAFFQGDGWTVWEQGEQGGQLRLTHYTLDGEQAWQVWVPSVLGSFHQVGSIELGPFDVLYVYYEDPKGAQVVAVPTSGLRAGRIAMVWPVPYTCYETYCGPPLSSTGIGLADGTTEPYLDASGTPIKGSFSVPEAEQATAEDRIGPAMPAEWPRSDGNGNSLISNRTTVALGATSWVFDAVGVLMAGDYNYLRQQVPGDGSVLVWFDTFDGVPGQETTSTKFLGILSPGGAMAFVQLPANVTDVHGSDGRIYVTTYDEPTGTYMLAELVTG